METGCSLTDTHALNYTPAHTETEEEGMNTENHIKLHGLKHERALKSTHVTTCFIESSD